MIDTTIKEIVKKALEEPTVSVQLFRSMHQEGNENSDTSATFTPGKGRTIVIEIEGGANNVEVNRVKTEDDEE